MKRLLALLAVSTALSSVGISAALADPNFVAGVAVGPQQLRADNPGGDFTIDGFDVQGTLSGAYNFTPVLGVQGDVVVNHQTFDADGEDVTLTSIDGALHGFYRDPDRFLAGGFVQVGRDEIKYDEGEGGKLDRGVVGVEGQAFFDQFTVYGQLGLQNVSIDGAPDDLDGWFINAEVRYFLTPDFKIEGHVGRSELNADFGITPSFNVQLETVNVGFGAEYKFDGQPFSIFGRYDFSTTSANISSDSSLDSHRVLVGLKFNLGEDSLQDRDRNGASLKPVEFNSSTFLNGGFVVPSDPTPP